MAEAAWRNFAATQFDRKFPQKNKKGDGSRGTIPSMFQRIFRIDAIRGAKTRSEATAAAESACPRPIRAGLSFVDLQGPALEFAAVQSADGLRRLVLVRHFDEAEASRLARRLVTDHRGFLDRSEGLEGLPEVGFRHVERKVANINVQTRLL